MATRASSLFSRGGLKMPHPKFMYPTTGAANIYVNGAGDLSTGASFWSNYSADGVAVDTNFTASVKKQIASLSGEGEFFSVLGPTAGGSETTTFELVIDGTTYTLAMSVASGERAGLHAAVAYMVGSTTGPYDPAYGVVQPVDMNAGRDTITGALGMPALNSPIVVNVPRIQFTSSLVVSITHSANVTGTASQERQSGAKYRMLKTWS